MAAAYLTPKPSTNAYELPACPPPPRAVHEPIDLLSFPMLELPRCEEDAWASDEGDGFLLAAFGVAEKSGLNSKNFPAKRSRDGRGATKSLPFVTLKLRPTFGVAEKSGPKHLPAKRSRDGRGATRSPPFIKLKPRPSKRPSPSARSAPPASGGKTDHASRSMTRSSSYQQVYLLSGGGSRKSKLPRRPSFSRAA